MRSLQQLKVTKRGQSLVQDPFYNKGTAFTLEERRKLGLLGLLPARISTLEEQVERAYHSCMSRSSKIERHYYLSDLQNRNQTLFYRLLLDHIDEMLPYVYTPAVGDAAVGFSLHYRQTWALYLCIENQEDMEMIFEEYENKDVDVIVVTDGERILGLGDMGVGGIVIPIGKLALYTVFAGIHPLKTLPIVLDIGTNNEKLLNDPYYIGLKKKRTRGEEYFSFIDRFVKMVKKYFPKTLLQWEDFSKHNAPVLLKKYEDLLPSFNDDIQGTAAVTLAGIFAALRRKDGKLEDEHIAIYGAGSAGVGIAELLVEYLERKGISKDEALEKIYLFNSKGLIHENRDDVPDHLKPYAASKREMEFWNVKGESITLLDVIKNAKITTLIGVSAVSDAFDKKVVEAMMENTKQPIIFPLSNPNSKCEAQPKDLIKWTKGKAIIATGSPFDPVEYKKDIFMISQCNNVYVYPSIGLAVSLFDIPKVTKGLFIAAAEALASISHEALDPHQSLYPPFHKLRKLTETLAFAVSKEAMREGMIQEMADLDMRVLIEKSMWQPNYMNYLEERVYTHDEK